MNPTTRDRGYVYFLSEAPDLLSAVEDGLLHLHERPRVQNVHSLMRATHTLKGAAANVGIESLKTIAHSMEDAFKALYSEEIAIDPDLEKLLFEGYECLRLRLSAEIAQTAIDDDELLDRAAEIFAQMRLKLGDDFGQKEYIPSSAELGFDIAQSIFELGVKQRLDELDAAVAGGDAEVASECLRSSADVFLGLGESLGLPGWGELAQTTIDALERHPDRALDIAELALADYTRGQQQVLAGDRESGGSPSPELAALASGTDLAEPPAVEAPPAAGLEAESNAVVESAAETALDIELQQFRDFLQDRRYGKPLPAKLQDFFCEAIAQVARWFAQTENIPLANFCCELMVPKLPAQAANRKKTVVRTASQIKQWVEAFLDDIGDLSDSESLSLYRQWTLLSVVVAVAKFQYRSDTRSPKAYDDVMLVVALRRLNKAVGDRYNALPPLDKAERNWLPVAREQLDRLDEMALADSPNAQLAEGLWGELADSEDEALDETDETDETSDAVAGDTDDAPENAPENPLALEAPSALSDSEAETQPEPEPSHDASHDASHDPPTAPIASVSDVSVEEHVNDGEFYDRDEATVEAKAEAQDAPPSQADTVPRQLVSVDIRGLERLNHRLGELLVERNRQALEEEALRHYSQDMRSQIQQHRSTLERLLDWSERTLSVLGQADAGFRSGAGRDGGSERTLSDLAQDGQLDSLGARSLAPCDGAGSHRFDNIADLHLLLKTAFGEMLQLDRSSEEIYGRSRELGQLMDKQQQLLSVMQDDLVDVRMLPLGEILQRFPLMVQQLSRIQGKQVQLELHGSDLLVEQSIAQKLYEPLLHLVRNAFDHGIESVEDRRQQGKPDLGTITIRAYNQGVQTTIEVRDDGRGLNLDWIRRKAIAGNFLSEDEAQQLVGEDRLSVIFEPGFSTANQVSEISGRGMGLDVVRSQLQTLKGKIAVESKPGRGTVFVLQIPLSISIAKLLVVQAGGSAYALLLDSIDKIVMPPPDRLKHFENHKVLQLENDDDTRTMVSVRQLADLLHYRSSLVESGDEPTTNKLSIARDLSAPILLLRHNDRQVGLEVDRILGEQELVIRPLGRAIPAPSYIYGCSILSDSRLALVLDGGEIVLRSGSPALDPAPPRGREAFENRTRPVPSLSASLDPVPPPSLPAAVEAAPKTTLLVIDDSINLRHTLTATLLDAGYEVIQARDGKEAIAQLQDNPHICLALCDVEMPNMNGFEFLNHCRHDTQLAQLPIVMLTSHSSPKYRQIAKELGATDYLTKPFSETELLATLDTVVTESA